MNECQIDERGLYFSYSAKRKEKKEKISENQGVLCPGRRWFALTLLECCPKALEHRSTGGVQPGRPRHAGECQHLASSWGPARADGIPAAARGMGTRRRVTARCLFGSSAALPGSMWESSSQQHLPGREYGLRFAANSPLLSSSQRDVRLDFYPPLLCPLRCPDLKQSGHISFKELRDGTLGSS